ncbi:MAG: hypothetical protein ACPL68_04095, partial [Candidatus Hydrothermia bacterium]
DKEDKERAQEVFKVWVEAHNDHKLSALDTLYADEVFYYSKNFKKRNLIKDKSEAFRPGSDFRIEVIDPQWEFNGDEATVNYEKYGYWKGKEVHVVSELGLKKFGKSWKITREVDTEVKSVNYRISKEQARKIAIEFARSKYCSLDLEGEGLGGEIKGPVKRSGVSCWKAEGFYYIMDEYGEIIALDGSYEIYISVEDGSIIDYKFKRRGPPGGE